MTDYEFNPDQYRRTFEAANELIIPIEDTNTRYQSLKNDEDLASEPDFYAIAEQGLVTEQNEAFSALIEGVDPSLYAILPVEYDRVSTEIEEAQVALRSVRAEMNEEQRHYDSLVVRVQELAPLGTDAAHKLAERRKAEIELARAGQLRERISKLEEQQIVLDGLFEIAGGKGWPIPLLVQRDTPQETEEVFVDEIPVEPHLARTSERRRLDRIRERHVDAPEASMYIVFYLTENKSKVVTVEDLVSFLYPQVSPDDVNLRGRVTTILGPKVQGPRIQEMLISEGDGYVLQYGWRRKRDPITDKPCGPARRIYRVLEESDISDVENIIHTNGDIDIFDDETAQPEVHEPELRVKNGETDTEEISVTPVMKSGSSDVTPETSDYERTREEQPALQTPEIKTKRTVKWKEDFRHAVGEAISHLEDAGLMEDGEVLTATARIKNPSTKFATREAFERLASAGLISNSSTPKTPNEISQFPLTPRLMVMMTIFNANDQVFRTRTRRNEAEKIIDACLNSYFDTRD